MCGICGKIYKEKEREVEEYALRKMTGSLFHRGPDDEGYFIYKNMGLGMRRLSIIDLPTGKQPISNEDKTIDVVFNGEIYNFIELREKTKKLGHTYTTNTDTETLVHLYEEYGDDFVHELNGMFAIALWDKKLDKLLLVRDRMGIKPLYYYEDDEKFLFASEIKALLPDGIKKDINVQALHDYLSMNYIASPLSIFKYVQKLPPGHLLVFKNNTTHVKCWWDIHFPQEGAESTPTLSEDEAGEQLFELLCSSIQYRLLSDVPLGAFLSGGVDSNAVVALMCKMSSSPVKTFSIGFEEKSFNELENARKTAKRYNTEHHEFVVKPNPNEILPKLAFFFDEPFADSSAIPMYYVSQIAKQVVTVALGGEGGDELFAGYDTYTAAHYAQAYKRLPSVLNRKLIPMVAERLPVSHSRVSFDYKAKRFTRAALCQPEEAHFMWKVIFNEEQKKELYHPDFYEEHIRNFFLISSMHVMEPYFKKLSTGPMLNRLQYVDLKVYLPDNNLTRVDRMSMAHSLEARVPLLDYRVVEYVAKLPPALRMKGLKRKYIFKKIMEPYLDHDILYGKKKGFNVPIPSWLNNALYTVVRDVLSPENIRRTGFFNENTVSRLITEHKTMKKDNSRSLWGLLMFMLWWENYYK